MLCRRSESFKLLKTVKQASSGLSIANQCNQTACKLSNAAVLLVDQSCTPGPSPLRQAAVFCKLQGKHTASDHLHARSIDHSPAQAAMPNGNMVQTSNKVQTSTMTQATRAAHTTHMAQISAQTKARSRVQTSACSAQCCSASGIMPRTLVLGKSSSSLTLQERCGGDAISAHMAILMPGNQVWIAGPMARPVPSVQTKQRVSTTPLPPDTLTLLRNSVTETRAQLMTT